MSAGEIGDLWFRGIVKYILFLLWNMYPVCKLSMGVDEIGDFLNSEILKCVLFLFWNMYEVG